MKNIFIMTLTLFMLAASITSRAGSKNTNGSELGNISSLESGNGNSLVGLWEAVDPDDGAHDILSITDNGDGIVKLLLYATYLTTCNGGRGVGQGTGEVSSEQSIKADDYNITCFETGDTVTMPTTFTRNSDGTLTNPRTGFFPPIIYHRTSK